jgi:hypothetical protein
VNAPNGLASQTDYEIRNAVGTLLFTSPDLDIAKDWLRDRAAQWPGAQVNEVICWRTERRVYKPVAYLRRVA